MSESQQADCYTAKLHLIGAIQPHGALLSVNTGSGRIEACSANVEAFLGLAPAQLLGQQWGDVLAEAGHLPVLLEGPRDFPLQRVWTQSRDGREQVVSACREGGQALVEVEWRRESTDFDFNSKIGFLKHLANCQTPEEVARLLLDYLARITGFERVMLYQFLPDWHGRVIAEQNHPGVEGFLGLHFPATDIPANARALYVKNLQRYIADTEADNVTLLARQPDQPLDLTWSQLRAVHPVHIEYLRNMGVRSSFSVSIITGGELWGMVACHQLSGVQPLGFKLRYLCEELARIASLHLSGLQAVAAEKRRVDLQLSLLKVERGLDLSLDVEGLGKQLLPVLKVLEADSLLLRLGGKSFAHGPLALSRKLGVLRKWLGKHAARKRRWHCSQVPEDLAQQPALVRHASGMLLIPFGPRRQGNYLLLARNEQVENIRWAGAAGAEPAGPLNPRASFAVWEQQTQGHAQPWDGLTLEVAEQLGESLSEELEKLHLERLAMQDSLTGLANRRGFEQALGKGIRSAQRHKRRLAVLLLDLDDFKPVNDTYGHDVGDEFLIAVGQRLKQAVRDRDTVARLGGDEFAIIQYHLGDAAEEEVALVAERIVEEVSRPVQLGEIQARVGVSLGIALYPDHGLNEAALLKAADQAMYGVKEAGKDGFRLHFPDTAQTTE